MSEAMPVEGMTEAAPATDRSSVSLTADQEWGLVPAAATSDTPSGDGSLSKTLLDGLVNFKSGMVNAMKHICKTYGGPRQYLNKIYCTAQKREGFAKLLVKHYPLKDTVSYVTDLNIPTVEQSEMSTKLPLVYHLSSFSFEEGASTKMPPGELVTLQLADEISTDGFITSGDPLLLSKPHLQHPMTDTWVNGGALLVQGIGYVKGQARVSVLLSMVSMALEEGFSGEDMKQVHPKLYDSICCIYGFMMGFQSKQDEVFANFKMSIRGSIRQKPNIITWVFAMVELAKRYKLTDSGAIVRAWNAMCSKGNALVGQKSQAVKNIMELLPEEGRNKVIRDVGEWSWENGPWSEDHFTSKKIFPGHVVRAASKAWNERRKVTKESCLLCLDHISHTHANTAVALRRKPTKAQVEEVSDLAAVTVNLCKEVQKMMPIKDDIMLREWLEKFAKNDPKVTTEITVALNEKSDKFHARDIPTLNSLMNGHSKTTPVEPGITLTVAADSVEQAEWELIEKQMAYDFKAYTVYDLKMKSFFTARDTIKQEWRKTTHESNMNSIETYLKENTLFLNFETTPDIAVNIAKFKGNIVSRHQITECNVVPESRAPQRRDSESGRQCCAATRGTTNIRGTNRPLRADSGQTLRTGSPWAGFRRGPPRVAPPRRRDSENGLEGA